MPDGGVAVAIAPCVVVAAFGSTGAGATWSAGATVELAVCDGMYMPSDSEPDGVGLDDGFDPPDEQAATSRTAGTSSARREERTRGP